MNIVDAIKQNTNEFGKLLYAGIFSKRDIEDYLKVNPDCADDYINKISEYICEKYENDLALYIELAKNYLNRNINEAIKYLNLYKQKGGNNKEVLFLLAKLYRQKGFISKFRNIIRSIELDSETPISVIEELFDSYLFDKKINYSKPKIIKIIKCFNKKKSENDICILGKILNKIIDNKILDANLKNMHGSERWINVVSLNFKKLGKEILENTKNKLGRYYFNRYISSGDKKFGNKFIVFINDKKVLQDMLINIFDDKIFNQDMFNRMGSRRWVDFIEKNIKYVKKNQLYEIVKRLKEYYNNECDTTGVIKNICEMININGAREITDELGCILKENDFSEKDKKKIIKILKSFYKQNTDIKIKNIFLNEMEILDNKTYLKSNPRELEVTVTTKCNLRCIMCDIHELPDYTIDNITYKYIKKLLPYLENIVWKGGEVFLYDKFHELIRFASKYNVRQTIITNGLFLAEEYVKLIAEYKVELVISIDSADKKTYEEIRKGADFNRLINNLEILKKHHIQNNSFKYKMIAVIMSVNYKQIEEIINFAILYNFESIYFQGCSDCENSYLLLGDLNKKEVIEAIEKYKNQYKDRIAILTDATMDINYFAKLVKDSFEVNSKIKDNNIVINKSLANQNKIISSKKFCYNPFFKMALNLERNNINFGCGCTTIDVSKLRHEEIWNCNTLVKYRQSILNGDLSVCNL